MYLVYLGGQLHASGKFPGRFAEGKKTEPLTGAKRGQIRCLLNLLDWESGGLKGFEGGVSLQKPL